MVTVPENEDSDARDAQREFLAAFLPRARAVQRARLMRLALSGLGVGLGLAAALTGVGLYWGLDVLRNVSVWLVPAGLAGGLGFGVHRRWNTEDVGLYLDARLGTRGSVTTALAPEGATRLLSSVYREAAQRLAAAQRTTPKVCSRSALAIPIAAATWAALLLLPAREVTAARPTPGTEQLKITELEGLEPVKQLDDLEALDSRQQQELRALAEQARELTRQLKDGMEQREALARIARLRDAIDAELGVLGNPENRPGMDAAVETLRREQLTRQAAKALGDADLVRFDAEMQKLAQAAEQAARDSAKQALAQALEAARKRGANAVSSALSEQQRLFEERERTADLMRQLARVMREGNPSESGNSGENAMPNLDAKSTRDLADALEKALESLTEEQRKQLAERLGKAIEEGQLDPANADSAQLQQLAKQLAEGQGQEELTELLRQLADPSNGARTMQGLRDAEDGLKRAQKKLAGALPVPQAAPGLGSGKQPGPQGKGTGNSPNSEMGGPGQGPGTGDHEGQTAPVDAEELRARTQPPLNPTQPLLQVSQGRTHAREGERARVPTSAALKAARAEAVQGVEHSSVPEEYREQVSRYFSD